MEPAVLINQGQGVGGQLLLRFGSRRGCTELLQGCCGNQGFRVLYQAHYSLILPADINPQQEIETGLREIKVLGGYGAVRFITEGITVGFVFLVQYIV